MIKPSDLTWHPKTNQLVYTPWNLSAKEVRDAVDALDGNKVKREIVEISEDKTAEKPAPIELGTIVNYDKLWELT